MKSIVIAVPKSTTIRDSPGKREKAPAAVAILSAPRVAGVLYPIDIGSFVL